MISRPRRALQAALGYSVYGMLVGFLPLTVAAMLLQDPAAQVVWFGGHAVAAAIGAGFGLFRVWRRGR